MSKRGERRALTARQVAAELVISPRTVHRMYKRGDLDGYPIGERGDLRIFADSLDAYIERRRLLRTRPERTRPPGRPRKNYTAPPSTETGP